MHTRDIKTAAQKTESTSGALKNTLCHADEPLVIILSSFFFGSIQHFCKFLQLFLLLALSYLSPDGPFPGANSVVQLRKRRSVCAVLLARVGVGVLVAIVPESGCFKMPSSSSSQGAKAHQGQAQGDNKTLPPKENALFKRILVRKRIRLCHVCMLGTWTKCSLTLVTRALRRIYFYC